MKVKSILKAIFSFFIWGLGQLFNKQYLKALFFFLIFVTFISLELTTSKYFYKETSKDEIAYNKISGDNFNDSWFERMPFLYYQYLNLANGSEKDKIKSEEFENYLKEIGVVFQENNGVMFVVDNTNKKFTQEKAIEFFADQLQKTSFKKYENLIDKTIIKAEEFKKENYSYINTKEVLYYNNVKDKFYLEVNKEGNLGENIKEYVETNLFTGVINNPEILSSINGLIKYEKENIFYKDNNNNFYVQTKETKKVNAEDEINIVYLKLNKNDEFIVEMSNTNLSKIQISGPIYLNESEIYEYYEPALIHNGIRLQYKSSNIFVTFRKMMESSYTSPSNTYTSADFEKFMLLIDFQLNPEKRDDFLKHYNNLFYDRAGIFLRGYWAMITLGNAKKQNYTSYNALSDALIGKVDDDDNLSAHINLIESIPIQGHVSTMLLIEGLIGVLLSLVFVIFLIWSVKDAYLVSEKLRKKEKVESGRKYFKSLWENSFEYIVLSPALLVLVFISLMPILFGFLIAFTSIKGNQSMVENFDYVGFKNFIQLFDFNSGLGNSFGKAFWKVLSWTIIWAILSTFTVFFGGFIQALILSSKKVVFRKLWRTILILPWAIPALLSQMVFSVMFKEAGFINQFLANIGIYDLFKDIGILGKAYNQVSGFAKMFWLGNEQIQWLSNPYNTNLVKGTLVFINIWLGFPYFMALMTGIMTAIDKSLYEAADIDGATGFQKLIKITVPLVLYSTAPILIMSFSGNFNNFGVIYFITEGGPNSGLASNGFAGDTDILISWMYKLTVDYSVYNMASVFSVLIFILVGSITAWNLSRTRAFAED